MITVGLTGGMGSGKTLVGKIFSTLGISVFNSDEETKKLYVTDKSLQAKLIALLGEEIYEDGQLRPKTMAAKIFSDKSLLLKVNAIVYPVVSNYFTRYVECCYSPYVIMESAVLYESGAIEKINKVITICAPEAVRIHRVMARDNVMADVVRQRLQYQWSEEQRIAASDFVIVNDGQTALLPQVLSIHEKILN